VLIALADTHGREEPRLTDHLRGQVATAGCVLHAGDFTTAAVLDAFGGLAERLGDVAVVNPGSHADPRGSRPAYATFEPVAGELRGRLHTPEGEPFATFRV